MKFTKVFLAISCVGMLLLVVVGGFIVHQLTKESNAEERKTTYAIYPVPAVGNAIKFDWHANNLYIQSTTTYSKYSAGTRESELITNIREGELADVDQEGEIYICTYTNSVITSPEQFATQIEIFDLNRNLVEQFSLHETVKPLSCNPSSILLTNNYHGAPEKYYMYDLNSSRLIETEEPVPEISIGGSGTTTLDVGPGLEDEEIQIDKINNFIFAKRSSDQSYIALLDSNGNVWIVEEIVSEKSESLADKVIELHLKALNFLISKATPEVLRQ